MKKILYIASLSLACIATTHAAIRQIKTVAQTPMGNFLSTFIRAYKQDPAVNAIIHLHDGMLQSCINKIDAKKVLVVEMPVPESNFKVVCECNYMGLALSTFTLKLADRLVPELQNKMTSKQIIDKGTVFVQTEIDVLCTIVRLLKEHGVDGDAPYVWTAYKQCDDGWVKVLEETTENRPNTTNKRMLEDLVKQFSPALDQLKALL